MEQILYELNEEQRRAVQTIDGPLLILAGAGTGKTKTITTRLAYLIDLGVDPASILTLTFTNKAAKEMRDRAFALIGDHLPSQPLLCTFHKFGLLFLRRYIHKLGRDRNFVIIDTDDKKRIIKSFKTDLPLSVVATEISRYKNSLISPEEAVASAKLENFKEISRLYLEYQNYLSENNLVDFDDLLILTYRILEGDPDIALSVSREYNFIMVDEYQDTNDIQNRLLMKLCSSHDNICVVGDDDQSIYGWRGANINNILYFHEHFSNAKIIRLEKNYRSTRKILEAANRLIEHNRNRLGKHLEAVREEGADIEVLASRDEQEEAARIAEKIGRLIDRGEDPAKIAVLFRINALSRSIEEALTKARIPFQLVGAIRFYERAEIKDIISYLRIISNPRDEFSLKRVINRPKRGVGKVTYERLHSLALHEGIGIMELLLKLPEEEIVRVVGRKSGRSLKGFAYAIDLLHQKSLQGDLENFIDEFERLIGLREYYSHLPDGMERVLNIDEFYGLFRDHMREQRGSTLEEFLAEISLQSDQDQLDGKRVSIMSVHASKGLEFKHLFVIGMEEGFFPLTGDGCDIEEERRLGYVAITRAMDRLTLSYVRKRFYRGRRSSLEKSRFLGEAGLCKGSIKIERKSLFKKGDLVKHKLFGIGRVIGISRAGKEFKLSINFGGTVREILASFVERI
ncbi:MAG: UvrD-helicase domain-containing protein [Epsilonproteobacteria bacterium]|nr:ATP-dependent DNA helicase [Campylobacterota bacterium]NPA56761.1 UvrD-helicase domain-containing protein [Campylobacterota bacterium]